MHSMYLTPHQKQVLGGGRPFREPLGMAPLEVGTSYRGGAARVAVVKRAMRAKVNFILVTCGVDVGVFSSDSGGPAMRAIYSFAT